MDSTTEGHARVISPTNTLYKRQVHGALSQATLMETQTCKGQASTTFLHRQESYAWSGTGKCASDTLKIRDKLQHISQSWARTEGFMRYEEREIKKQ